MKGVETVGSLRLSKAERHTGESALCLALCHTVTQALMHTDTHKGTRAQGQGSRAGLCVCEASSCQSQTSWLIALEASGEHLRGRAVPDPNQEHMPFPL